MNTSFGWHDPISHSRRALGFQNRKPKYGAYVLRKNYPKRLLIAFTITVSVILILIDGPIIFSFFFNQILNAPFQMSKSVNLEEPHPIDKVDPPTSLIIPPPVAQTIKFTAPKDKDGKIKDAKVMKGIGSGCDEEALRVILPMPDWKPGRQNGKTVQVRSNSRVNFSLK